jgi:uncharacterized protein YneF (UPF0154 family)
MLSFIVGAIYLIVGFVLGFYCGVRVMAEYVGRTPPPWRGPF